MNHRSINEPLVEALKHVGGTRKQVLNTIKGKNLWKICMTSDSLVILNLRRTNFCMALFFFLFIEYGTIPNAWTSGSKLIKEDWFGLKQVQWIGAKINFKARDSWYWKQSDQWYFPFSLGNLCEFKILILHSNGFCGAIVGSNFNFMFYELRIFDISFNNLTGCLQTSSKIWLTWNLLI